MRNIFGRRFLVSNPFLGYGGICAEDNTVQSILVKKAEELAVKNSVEYVEIRQLAGTTDILPVKTDFVAFFLHLGKNEESIWNNTLKPKVRNQVRKAVKSGLTIDFGNRYLDDFYRVLAVNHRDLGTPLHRKAFFREVLDEFHGSSGIIVVKHKGTVIAGMLYIHFRGVLSDPWASSLREYNKLCPNNILYWEAIKFACRNGFEYFDFGRSTIGCGTCNFKKQWGAEQIQLNYQYYLNRAKEIPEFNAFNNKYKLAINIWKRLPLTIANIIGPRVVRYLPEL
jgi:FemAB-related protein (PEP-CTERM system-associated)